MSLPVVFAGSNSSHEGLMCAEVLSRTSAMNGLLFDLSRREISSPALTWNDGRSTRRPLIITCPWTTICRACGMVRARPKRQMMLSRRAWRRLTRFSPAAPFIREALTT